MNLSTGDHSVAPPRIDVPRDYNAAHDLIERNLAADRGAKIAYIDDAGETTYAQLAERVDRFASGLTALGLDMEHRVMIAMLDTIDWPVAFLGAIKAGIVPVAVNTLLTTKEYEFMLSDSRARALIVSEALLPAFAPLLQRLPFLKHVIVSGADAKGHLAFKDVLAKGKPKFAAAPTTRDDPCFWLYSSGSTGMPKGTVHVHSGMIVTAELYARPILGIAEKKPTIFYGVPTLYAALLADSNFPQKEALALRICTSAGEALPPQIGKSFKERTGVEVLDGIGSTEMLHIFLSNRPGDVRPGTTGKPVPGYELKLTDEQGNEVKRGELGELQIGGPTSANGYWNNREKSRSTFIGTWTRSGDKYSQDADGYYVYGGRSDDMLKVSGIYVSPAEVEAALVSHDAVLEAAVVGAEDENRLVKPKAYIVLKAGRTGDEKLQAALQQHVKDRLAPYKYPRWIEFLPELPKTATGKIQRFKLRGAAK
ncbi:MAG TPA: benzoate-CoA ligase family protein [Burkholderiales bacterium]|nr:benzoate-CoA ligase family protein [Burkholderiales bacterium]